MVVNSKQMAKIAVQTRSGVRLGRLASLDIDADTGRLTAIRVSSRGALADLFAGELVIVWQQIVSMTQDAIVVEDASVPYAATQLAHSQET